MNCDTCAYRVLMPGFADKVGRPQTPHDHPDDPVDGHGHHHHHEGGHHHHEGGHHHDSGHHHDNGQHAVRDVTPVR